MGIIFTASSDPVSFQHSSRWIGPLVRWLFPDLGDDTVGAIVFGIRKCAHVAEYAVLAMLLSRALGQPGEKEGTRRRWPAAWLALGLAALYAATDELHQGFVPTRQASVWDVLLDSAGAALGLLLLRVLRSWRQRWRSGNPG